MTFEDKLLFLLVGILIGAFGVVYARYMGWV
jgi:cell division protein FtsL